MATTFSLARARSIGRSSFRRKQYIQANSTRLTRRRERRAAAAFIVLVGLRLSHHQHYQSGKRKSTKEIAMTYNAGRPSLFRPTPKGKNSRGRIGGGGNMKCNTAREKPERKMTTMPNDSEEKRRNMYKKQLHRKRKLSLRRQEPAGEATERERERERENKLKSSLKP